MLVMWFLVGALMLFSLGGCSTFGGFIASELSRYAEPVDGPLAHLRLVGSRNVKLYPNSGCVSIAVPGSGYPAGPQMGGQRKRDLGDAGLRADPAGGDADRRIPPAVDGVAADWLHGGGGDLAVASSGTSALTSFRFIPGWLYCAA